MPSLDGMALFEALGPVLKILNAYFHSRSEINSLWLYATTLWFLLQL
jgi:hypothetical protein